MLTFSLFQLRKKVFTQLRLTCFLCHLKSSTIQKFRHLFHFFPLNEWEKKSLSNMYPAYLQGSIFRVRLLERRHLSLSGPNKCCGSSSSKVLLLKMCKMIWKGRCCYVMYLVLMNFKPASLVHHVLRINTHYK